MDEPKKSKRLIIWNGRNMYFVLLAMFVVGKEWEAKIYSEIFVLKHASFWFVRIPKRFDFLFYDFLVIYYAISKF